jgi:MFS family permease
MTLVNLGRAALIAALAVLVAADHEGLWVLYVVGFALGIGETLFDTAAQSILPNIVTDKDQLARANGRLYAVELTANQFVGPPLGGVIVAVSAALALMGSAVSYLLAALVLTTLVGKFRPERTGPPTRIHHDIAEGMRYLFGHRVLRTLALCVGLSNLAFTAFEAVLALYVVDPGPMGLSEAGYGLLLTTFALGSLLATPMVDKIQRRFGTTTSLLGTLLLFPLMAVVPAITAWWVPFAVVSVVTGFANVVWNVLTVSLRQKIVPDRLLGRVNSGYRLLAWGTMPIGAAMGGVLGELIGLRGLFWITAGLGLLCVPLLLSGVSDAAIAAAEAEGESEEMLATT